MNKATKEIDITDEIKDKIYNHILGYFEMYYSNGDFGYYGPAPFSPDLHHQKPYIATVMCGFASTDAFGQHPDLIWQKITSPIISHI